MRGFELSCSGRRIDVPISAQRLVAFLALQDRPQLRLHVAGTLWTDSSEKRSNGSLRSALWRLHRPGFGLVDATGEQLSLADSVVVDVHRVCSLARQLVRGRQEFSVDEVDDLTLGGELLPGWYDDWVLLERERVRQLRLHALELLCERLVEQRRFTQAVEAGMAAVDGEPLRESAHRTLIKAHLAEGNRAEALRQFGACRRILEEQLRLPPSGEMRHLVEGL
jgi:DNA-binding SARP family transcriptional activator